jgi:Zn-dependent protease
MMKANFFNLLSNREYIKVLFAFTIALGQLNAVAALINQLPGDYSNGEAGTVGAVLILCGFLGAFLTGFVLNHFKSYKEILQRYDG